MKTNTHFKKNKFTLLLLSMTLIITSIHAEMKCESGKCAADKKDTKKCADGKCGDSKKEMKCAAGKCGDSKKAPKKGKCGE